MLLRFESDAMNSCSVLLTLRLNLLANSQSLILIRSRSTEYMILFSDEPDVVILVSSTYILGVEK